MTAGIGLASAGTAEEEEEEEERRTRAGRRRPAIVAAATRRAEIMVLRSSLVARAGLWVVQTGRGK